MRLRDERQRQRVKQLDDGASNSEPATLGAKSPCPSEGKGSPLKWLVRIRPEGRPCSGRVGCSCRRCWLWLTLLGRAPRLLKIEREACETFRAGLYLLYTAQPLAYYHICLILAQGEGGVH